MKERSNREVEHRVSIDAPAADVYRLVAEVENWPQLFPPTIHVEHVERSGHAERIRIWATANGQVKDWISRRTLSPDRLRIDFRQEVPAPPVAAMGGTWLIEPVAEHEALVRLRHDYRAANDDPDQLAWIEQAVDRNSQAELAALKASVERATSPGEDAIFSFADTVAVRGPAKDVYEFLNEARQWPERLPHVSRVALTEEVSGLQILEMDTRAKNGSIHTTKSVRVCFPHHKIVYKQIGLPALMTLHTGYWLVAEDPSGVGLSVTSQHTVAINEVNVGQVLGADAGLAQAREFVRDALSTNSLATLARAKQYAESGG